MTATEPSPHRATDHDRVLDLTVTATRSHLVHAATLLRSLCEAMPRQAFRVHLLHDGPVTTSDLQPLRASLEPFPIEVVDVAVPTALQARLPGHRFHVSAWFRVLLPRLAPELDRVVHLDVDAVVVDDLAPLWDLDLQGLLFAAVANPLYPFQPEHWRTDLGLAAPREYPNTGVLVMDLASMREAGLVDELLAYADAHPDNAWPEQDALAETCRGRWHELHPRWNVQTTLYDLDLDQLPYTSDELADALARPAIVHYIGPYKPWTHACQHPLRHLYHHARKGTAYGSARQPRTRRQRVMRRLREPDRARVALAEHHVRRVLRRAARSMMGTHGGRHPLRRRVVSWYRERPADGRLRRGVRGLLETVGRLERRPARGPWFDLRTNGEAALLRTLARHLSVEVVVDVGANVGEWYEAARAAFPTARVVLVEIAPPLWEGLEQRVAEDDRAELMTYGLAAQDGTVALRWYPQTPALSTTVAFPHAEDWQEVTAPVRSVAGFLDDAGLDAIDVMKVDIEGAELPVVAGLEDLMVRRRVGVVQFEYGEANILTHALLYDYARLAARTGYRLGRLHAAGVDFTPYQFAHEDFRPRNMLLCRPDLADQLASFEN